MRNGSDVLGATWESRLSKFVGLWGKDSSWSGGKRARDSVLASVAPVTPTILRDM